MNGLTFFQKKICYSTTKESIWQTIKFSPNPVVIVNCENLTVEYLNLSFLEKILATADNSDHIAQELFSEDSNAFLSNYCKSMEESDLSSHLFVLPIDGDHHTKWRFSTWKARPQSSSSFFLVIEFKDVTSESLAIANLIAVNQKLLIASVDQHEIASVVKTLNKKLHEASIVKNQFIAVMNHEIRTPLNAIIGFSDLMLDDPSEADRMEYSGRIKRNGKVLLHLIEDLLDLSKIEADCLEVENRRSDLRQIFDDVDSMLQPIAMAKGVDLDWSVDPLLPKSVTTDATRFKQILTNIIGNALKFTSNGIVQVDVKINRGDTRLEILISDSGEGIAEEHKKKIFEPFAQADSTITRRFGGTGLGLHLSRRIAREMGGDIELLSSEIHVGSSFLIILPVKEAIYSLSAPDTLGKKREYNLSGLKILLVEDAPDNQLLMTHILKNSGCYLEVVSNGELAIERVATKDFDLILMDIGMPVMDGITATRILRKRDYKGSIIALSAHAMKSEVEECLRSGFDAHISKPVDFDRLMNTIVETSKMHIPYSASSQRNDLTEEKQLH